MTPEIPIINEEGTKILSFDQVVNKVLEEKKRGSKVGLITGCFDVIHIGHVDLFRSAKHYVDILVVGVERDETLMSKSPDRPFNKLGWRCELLSELISVDLIYPNEFVIELKPSDENDALFKDVYERLNPDYLITNPDTDNYWELRKQKAKEIGIGFLGIELRRKTSSTDIIRRLNEDN